MEGALRFPELFLLDDFVFDFGFAIFKAEVAHLAFQLLFDVQSPPKLMVAIFKFDLVAVLLVSLFVKFTLFPAEHTTDFLSNDHKRPESFLDGACNVLDKIVSGEGLKSPLDGFGLEHLPPYFVSSQEEAETNCLQ